jgi:N,N'-diacetyllegionaminate synthase
MKIHPMKKCIVIAEAGVNHNGSIELAKKLVEAAAEAGADYVKFQTFKASKLVSVQAQKADYQLKNTGKGEVSQLKMLEKLELSSKDFEFLKKYCSKFKIKFLSTAFDLDSIDFLATLDLDVYKVPSGEITNVPYLKKVALKSKKVILSTGMSTLSDIEKSLEILLDGGIKRENITVLHCNTEYPTPFRDVNLKAMLTIQEAFKVHVGYSDHTPGIEIPVAAVALGATVIEKHFTLDKTMDGPDHKASLEPAELKQMIFSIRHVEQALGNGIKEPSESEKKNIVIARKSIHLSKDLKKGDIVTEDSLIMLRPGDGIPPNQMEAIIGKKTVRNLKAGRKIDYQDFTH